jgi:hypothetical protein
MLDDLRKVTALGIKQRRHGQTRRQSGLLVHGRHGQIRERDGQGHDPRQRKG